MHDNPLTDSKLGTCSNQTKFRKIDFWGVRIDKPGCQQRRGARLADCLQIAQYKKEQNFEFLQQKNFYSSQNHQNFEKNFDLGPKKLKFCSLFLRNLVGSRIPQTACRYLNYQR